MVMSDVNGTCSLTRAVSVSKNTPTFVIVNGVRESDAYVRVGGVSTPRVRKLC